MNSEDQIKEKEKAIGEFLKILHDEVRHLETIFIRTVSFFAVLLAAINIVTRHFIGYRMSLLLTTYFSFGLFFILLQFYDRVNLIRSKQKLILADRSSINSVQKSFYSEILQFSPSSVKESDDTKNDRGKFEYKQKVKNLNFSKIRNKFSSFVKFFNYFNNILIKYCKSDAIAIILVIMLFLIQLYIALHRIDNIFKIPTLLISEIFSIYVMYLKVKEPIRKTFSGQILAFDIIFSSYSYIFLFLAFCMFITLDYSLFDTKNVRPRELPIVISLISNEKTDIRRFRLVTDHGDIYSYINLPGQKLPDFVIHSLETKGEWSGRAMVKLLNNFSSRNSFVTVSRFFRARSQCEKTTHTKP